MSKFPERSAEYQKSLSTANLCHFSFSLIKNTELLSNQLMFLSTWARSNFICKDRCIRRYIADIKNNNSGSCGHVEVSSASFCSLLILGFHFVWLTSCILSACFFPQYVDIIIGCWWNRNIPFAESDYFLSLLLKYCLWICLDQKQSHLSVTSQAPEYELGLSLFQWCLCARSFG